MGKVEIKFRKFSTERCKVLNSKDNLLGEIRRIRVGYYMHWVFCPRPSEKLADVWFTKSTLNEISEKIKDLYKRGRVE